VLIGSAQSFSLFANRCSRAIALGTITGCEQSKSPMALRQIRSILLCEMVVGAYTEQYSFPSFLPRRRCAIEELGIPRCLLSPPNTPNTAFPSSTFESAFLVALSRRAMSGDRALIQRIEAIHEGTDG
jgi:hypothetical protein